MPTSIKNILLGLFLLTPAACAVDVDSSAEEPEQVSEASDELMRRYDVDCLDRCDLMCGDNGDCFWNCAQSFCRR